MGPLFNALRTLPEMDVLMQRQAFTLGLVDDYLRSLEDEYNASRFDEEAEAQARAAYIWLEALSQLWVFGLYELLRSWRQRAKAQLGRLAARVGRKSQVNLEPLLRRRLRQDPDGAQRVARRALLACLEGRVRAALCAKLRALGRAPLDEALATTAPVFELLTALRVNLAKFEQPARSTGRPGNPVQLLPSVSRPHGETGSPLWFVELGNQELRMVSRRDLAERLSEALLPPPPARRRARKGRRRRKPQESPG